METTAVNNPKDDQVTNKDDSVTNKDGDNYLEKGERPTGEEKNAQQSVPTVTPDNENGDPGPPNKGHGSKDPAKDREFSKHNL
jgi:hypothetical protein